LSVAGRELNNNLSQWTLNLNTLVIYRKAGVLSKLTGSCVVFSQPSNTPALRYDVSEGQIKHHLLNDELMLENGNFGFIFCFNEVNMLKGIKGFAPTGMLGTKWSFSAIME
jgi:hypothetical protein